MTKPLTKAEFEEKVYPGTEAIWESVVNVINQKLLHSNGNATISFKEVDTVAGHFTDDIYKKIEHVYKDGGWNVKHESGYDQRDNESWNYIHIYK